MQSTGRGSVVDVALQGTGLSTAAQLDRVRVLQRLRLGDVAFRHLTRAAAATVLIILGGIIVSLVWGPCRPCARLKYRAFTKKSGTVTRNSGAIV
jgi:hypothetical protein